MDKKQQQQMRNKTRKLVKKPEILNSLSDLVNNFLVKILMYGHILCRVVHAPSTIFGRSIKPNSSGGHLRLTILLRTTPDFQTLQQPCSKSAFLPPPLAATVLPNGVNVAVWDLSKIFQKWKKLVFSCTLHSYWINLVQKWASEYMSL